MGRVMKICENRGKKEKVDYLPVAQAGQSGQEGQRRRMDTGQAQTGVV